MIAKGFTIDLPPHGYVRYIDHFGSDQRIVESARISYKSPSKGEEADKKLLAYLYRNQHMTPFEQPNVTFNIKMPIFVMRQFVRHRTFRLNEMSARYTDMPDQFFLPTRWRIQDKKNRQGSLEHDDVEWNALTTRAAEEAYEKCYKLYRYMVDALDVAKEQARMVLPVALYTEIYVNCDLRNLMHFLGLRLDTHAQSEIRDVAQAMCVIAEELYPWTMKVFRRYKKVMVDTHVDSPTGREV